MQFAQVFFRGDEHSRPSKIVPLVDGQSIEEIARLCCEHAFAIRTGWVARGTKKIGEETVPAMVAPWGVSPRTFLGGQVFTNFDAALIALEESTEENEDIERLLSEGVRLVLMEANGVTQVILCRTGQFEPFGSNDKVLPLNSEA